MEILIRNVIGLATLQFDTIVYQYGELKKVGQGVIKEINVIAE
jgi:hypothetical protein